MRSGLGPEADTLTHATASPFSVHKGETGSLASNGQSHNTADGWADRTIRPCLDCNTFALFVLTATFLPTECLAAPASDPSACGPNGSERPARDPGPLRDASGAPRLSSVSLPKSLSTGTVAQITASIIVSQLRGIFNKEVAGEHINQRWRSKRHAGVDQRRARSTAGGQLEIHVLPFGTSTEAGAGPLLSVKFRMEPSCTQEQCCGCLARFATSTTLPSTAY
jgi:hypothetical protein